MIDERPIARRYRLLAPHLTDRERRLWAASEVIAHGPRSITTISKVTGITPAAIQHAQQELQPNAPPRSSE